MIRFTPHFSLRKNVGFFAVKLTVIKKKRFSQILLLSC